MDLDTIPLADDTNASNNPLSGQEATTVELDSDSSDTLERMDRRPLTRAWSHNVDDDKKKLALNTSYDGFSIYGRILCLIVTRKRGGSASTATNEASGQDMMKDWIASTQAPKEVEIG